MTETPERRALIVKDVVAAITLRQCLREAIPELEIAIGFRDWKGVRRALERMREALLECS